MDFIYQNIALIAVAVVSGAGLLWQLVARAPGNEVSPASATLLINREDAVVIDIREPDEYAAGHLPEARNLPLSRLKERISEIEKFKEKPLVVCCTSGVRSAKACGELAKLGFAKAHSLAGGVDAWVGAGYPIKKGTRNK